MPRQPLLATEAYARRIARAVRRTENLRGAGVRITDDAIEIIQQIPRPVPVEETQAGESATILKIIGSTSPATLGKPYYWALIQKRKTAAWTPTSNSVTSTFFENVGTATDYVIFYNLLDKTATSPRLAADTFLSAFPSGDTASVNGTNYAVYRSESVVGPPILDLRYNTTTFWIQATSALNPIEADWVNKIQVSTCPAGASAAGSLSLFGSDDFGRSSGVTEMTLSKPASNTVLLDTASTSKDGTGAKLLVTAGANGAVVTRIDFQATTTTQAGPIRIWHQPGGTGDKLFIDQIEVEDQTPNSTKRPWSGQWLPKDSPNPFMLKGLDKLYAGFYYTDPINATVNAADVT